MRNSIGGTLIFLYAVFLAFKAGASTQQEIRVVADHWKDYTNPDGSGVYIEAIKEIFEPHGYTINFQIMPFKRAVSKINSGSADILLAEEGLEHLIDSRLYNAENLLSPQQPIGESIVSALFPIDSSFTWGMIKQDHHARIAWVRGYDYRRILDLPHKNLQLINNSQQGLKMLLLGRVDSFIDDIQDSIVAKRNPYFSDAKFKYSLIRRYFLYPIFQKSNRGEVLSNLYDKGMKDLVSSQRFRDIYNENSIVYPFDLSDKDLSILMLPPGSGMSPVNNDLSVRKTKNNK